MTIFDLYLGKKKYDAKQKRIRRNFGCKNLLVWMISFFAIVFICKKFGKNMKGNTSQFGGTFTDGMGGPGFSKILIACIVATVLVTICLCSSIEYIRHAQDYKDYLGGIALFGLGIFGAYLVFKFLLVKLFEYIKNSEVGSSERGELSYAVNEKGMRAPQIPRGDEDLSDEDFFSDEDSSEPKSEKTETKPG